MDVSICLLRLLQPRHHEHTKARCQSVSVTEHTGDLRVVVHVGRKVLFRHAALGRRAFLAAGLTPLFAAGGHRPLVVVNNTLARQSRGEVVVTVDIQIGIVQTLAQPVVGDLALLLIVWYVALQSLHIDANADALILHEDRENAPLAVVGW